VIFQSSEVYNAGLRWLAFVVYHCLFSTPTKIDFIFYAIIYFPIVIIARIAACEARCVVDTVATDASDGAFPPRPRPQICLEPSAIHLTQNPNNFQFYRYQRNSICEYDKLGRSRLL